VSSLPLPPTEPPAPAVIAEAFSRTVPAAIRQQVAEHHQVEIGDYTDRPFPDLLLDLHAATVDGPVITYAVTHTDIPDDRRFLVSWAATIAYHRTRPLWPRSRDITPLVDRAYDYLCQNGHVRRQS
jgi:hypothetical protein